MAAWRYGISLVENIFQHSKRNFISPCGHVISSMSLKLCLLSCLVGSLALYDATDEGFQLTRVLPNTVVMGGKFGPHVLSVSEDSLRLAFIGPSEYTVTVANARSLDEVSFK